MEREEEILEAIKANKGKLTPHLLAGQLHLDIKDAQRLLKEFMKAYKVEILVTDKGELVYNFGETPKRLVKEKRSIWPYIFIALGVLLLVFLLLIGAHVLLVLLIFGLGLMVIPVDSTRKVLTWFLCQVLDNTPQAPAQNQSPKDSKNKKKKDSDNPFAEIDENLPLTKFSVTKRLFSQDFPDVKQLREEVRRFKCEQRTTFVYFSDSVDLDNVLPSYAQDDIFLDYITATNGIITVSEWALLFGVTLKEAKKALTNLYIKYDADVWVDEQGNLIFDFSALLSKNSPDKKGATKWSIIPKFFYHFYLEAFWDKTSSQMGNAIVVLSFLQNFPMIFLALLGMARYFPSLATGLRNSSVFTFMLLWSIPSILISIIPNYYAMVAPIFLSFIAAFLIGLLAYLQIHVFYPVLHGIVHVFPFLDFLTKASAPFLAIYNKFLHSKDILDTGIVDAGFLMVGISLAASPFYFLYKVWAFRRVHRDFERFKSALYYFVLITDSPVPADVKEAAKTLGDYCGYTVPVIKDKDFSSILGGLGAEFTDNGLFCFPAIKSQKEAVKKEKPRHELSGKVVYSSEDE